MSDVVDGSHRFAQRRRDEQRRANQQLARKQHEELTERMGVPQSVVSRVELGYNLPNLITLHNHCSALDWALVDLFTHVQHLQEEA